MAFSLRRKRQAPQGRYTPNLWPVWLVAPLVLVLAGLLGWGIYHYAYDYFTEAAADRKPPQPVNINDVLKATVTALTLVGAVLAGLYAYRKQLLAEGDAHRADASQLADRYTTASGQLGHDQAAVRRAGVYALTHLADDWTEQRQVCIDVLCAYLRMPYEPDRTSDKHKEGEREVRHTIIRVIRDHLRDPTARASWCACTFDFTGAYFDGCDLTGSHFHSRVFFDNAEFGSGEVSFDNAYFSDGEVTFDHAAFGGSKVSFQWATFGSSEISFNSAAFRDGEVSFDNAHFSRGKVIFDQAAFGGGEVTFDNAVFSGSEVTFDQATFGGSKISFQWATLGSGQISFKGATFGSGQTSFDHAVFRGGKVSFDHAVFGGGEVSFDQVRPRGGEITFEHAVFSGTAIRWGPIPVPAG